MIRAFVRRCCLLLLLGSLAGCMPLFVPPVPMTLSAEATWRIAPGADLQVLRDAVARPRTLRATWTFEEAGPPGWVSVQWFGPVGGERASAARWFDGDDVGQAVVWDSPDDLGLTRGRWRLVVSIHDSVLRQLDVEID
jgi:hypothetical protein